MTRAPVIIVGALVCGGGAAATGVQEAGTQHAAAEQAGEVTRLPSLDELLGLAPSSEGSGGAPASGAEALDRTLRDESPRGGFERAAALMDDAAARLGVRGDVSIETQRIQAEALARLDEAIAAANRAPPSPSSSSSSSSSPQNQPAQPQAQNSPGQNQPGAGEPDEGPRGGSTQAGTLDTTTPEAAAWGALPERLRGQLLQGLGDRYSSLYQRTTEEYYRRLAEEAGR
jgi:hypothetical protein